MKQSGTITFLTNKFSDYAIAVKPAEASNKTGVTANQQTGDKVATSPETSDINDIVVWIALLIASGSVLVGAKIKRIF